MRFKHTKERMEVIGFAVSRHDENGPANITNDLEIEDRKCKCSEHVAEYIYHALDALEPQAFERMDELGFSETSMTTVESLKRELQHARS